jgi:hypothetical protein
MKIKKIWLAGFLLLISGLFFAACEEVTQPTYGPDNPDPNPTGLVPATLDSISPGTAFFSEEVKIYGKDFNTDPSYNLVTFSGKRASVTAASGTELTVMTPGFIGETVDVKVAIKGSEFWSDPVEFIFKSLPETHDLKVIDEEINWAMGIAVDDAENVYIGSAADSNIYKITPDGTKSEFVSVPILGHIHFGPEDYLYVCERDDGKIVRVSPDGSSVEDVVEVSNPLDFDWDANGVMWIVLADSAVQAMGTDGNLSEVTLIPGIKNCRVFGDYLYVSIIWDGLIVAYKINGTTLEGPEIEHEIDVPVSFDFAANGLMIFARAWDTSLYTLFSDGSEGAALYEEEMMTPMRYMVWHNKSIYVVYPGGGEVGMAMKAYIGLEQAPRYGQQ